ncbi:phage integrase N-terminal SAM-like domain-containing protein [Desulforhopalus vacuolatus]
MEEREIERFLSHLASAQNVAESLRRQNLNALVFLYRNAA